MNILLPKHTEFEVKIKIDNSSIIDNKLLIERLPGLIGFKYVEGPDTYFVNGEDFLRYRKASFNDSDDAELTMKKKTGDKNNFNRKEWNLKLGKTPKDTVFEMIENLGFKFNFKIWKSCHIYTFDDANVVIYTVSDLTDGVASSTDSFIEIEVDETITHRLTEEEAWDIIKKYEKHLSKAGVSPQRRMRKSLFEIYKR